MGEGTKGRDGGSGSGPSRSSARARLGWYVRGFQLSLVAQWNDEPQWQTSAGPTRSICAPPPNSNDGTARLLATRDSKQVEPCTALPARGIKQAFREGDPWRGSWVNPKRGGVWCL